MSLSAMVWGHPCVLAASMAPPLSLSGTHYRESVAMGSLRSCPPSSRAPHRGSPCSPRPPCRRSAMRLASVERLLCAGTDRAEISGQLGSRAGSGDLSTSAGSCRGLRAPHASPEGQSPEGQSPELLREEGNLKTWQCLSSCQAAWGAGLNHHRGGQGVSSHSRE